MPFDRPDDIYYDVDTGKQYFWAGDHYEYLPPPPEIEDGSSGGGGDNSPIPQPPKPQQKNPRKPGKNGDNGNDSGDNPDKPKKGDEDPQEDGDDDGPGKGSQEGDDEDPTGKGKGSGDEDDGDEETPEEFAERIAKIRRILDNPEWQEHAVDEVRQAVDNDNIVRAKKERERIKNNSPMIQFTESLNDFIRNQIRTGRGTSWSKINKKYAHSGIIKPGSTRKSDKPVPMIAVYWDQSGSWDESDIKVGQQAIDTLRKYEDKKQIVIEQFYFANHIHDNPRSARSEGGTGAGKELIEHINNPRTHFGNRKPDNVIVMTDSDFDHWDEITGAPNISVKGAVWFLFRGSESRRLQEHLRGDALNKKFMLEDD